uniref:Uncharacterized protein n=1 Tax=Panagrolaimus sp. JU765 TaxID=591449 RepID=A0AC34QLN3_9BILA
MRWCCGGLDTHENTTTSITAPIIVTSNPLNGGSNGRRQQLLIQGDQVVLDATTSTNLNHHHAHFSVCNVEIPTTSKNLYKNDDNLSRPQSPRHSSLIMDKHGPMLLKPCKII